jgi:hypothetical protein
MCIYGFKKIVILGGVVDLATEDRVFDPHGKQPHAGMRYGDGVLYLPSRWSFTSGDETAIGTFR